MKAQKAIELQAKIDKAINNNGDEINEQANDAQQFIKESAIQNVLKAALTGLYSDEAISLALESSVIQDAICDLCFDFAGRVIAGDAIVKGE